MDPKYLLECNSVVFRTRFREGDERSTARSDNQLSICCLGSLSLTSSMSVSCAIGILANSQFYRMPCRIKLTVPQLSIHTILTHQEIVRATLRHTTIVQDNDLIAVINSPQPVSNKDACPSLLFQDAINVLKEALLSVGVKGRSLLPG